MPTPVLAALSAIAAMVSVAVVAKILSSFGAGKKVGDAIQDLPDVEALAASSSSQAVHAAAVVGHYIELAAKKQLTGDKLQAFCVFLATSPTSTQVLAYAEQNFGAGFLTELEASIPGALQDELAIFGDHLPAVIKDFVGKLLPGIATTHATQQITAAEVAGKLAAAQVQASAGKNAGTAAAALE